METAVFATTCKPGLLEPYWGMLALGRFCIATTVRPSRSVSKKRLGIIFLRRIETTWQNGSPDKQYYLLFIRAGVGGGGGGGGGRWGRIQIREGVWVECPNPLENKEPQRFAFTSGFGGSKFARTINSDAFYLISVIKKHRG